MKDFIYGKLIKYFVLLSPIIDIITSYMYYHDYSITIGILAKDVILLLALFYLLVLDSEKKKKNFLYLFILGMCIIVNIYNNLDVIKIAFFSYFNYLFKYVYYFVMLLFFVRWYKEYNLKLSDLRIPILIISLTSIIAIITKTAYPSYQYNPYKEGLSMWYSSANELGNILCLLFPVCIYNAFHNKDGIRLDLYLVLVCGALLLILGTKVGLFGYFLIIICYLIIRLLLIKVSQLDSRFFIMLIMLLVPLLFWNNLPGVNNIKVSYEEDSMFLLSGRDEFLQKILEKRREEGVLSKVFGKSYYGELKNVQQIMLVEQDFIDIFFMYGYVGLLFTVGPIIYLFYGFFSTFIRIYKKENKISKKYLSTFIAITFVLMISFISGHAILTPSVSLYLVLLIALLFNLKFNSTKIIKESILVNSISNNTKLSKKYDINIINEDKLWKIRFFVYLSVKNKKYDYVLMNDKDSRYMKTYLKYSSGKHINYKDFIRGEKV